MKTTQAGRQLATDLGLGSAADDAACSRLHRLAKRCATIQERWCSEDMSGTPGLEDRVRAEEEKIEDEIRVLAKQLDGIKGVKFTGDPRGFTVRVFRKDGKYNTWGGAEGGWGIA